MTRALRAILLALLLSLLAGFVAGTLLRQRLERPVQYLGTLAPPLPLSTSGTPQHFGHFWDAPLFNPAG